MFRIKFLEMIAVDVLKAINGIVGNYGIAIIIVTILMRILIFPLTLKQEKSMKKMKDIQPEVDKIREKYKDDPQTLNQKTMEIYKENNVNPMGGCLPILIQMPIFVALYYAFVGNTIPSDATFLWFNLKQPDHFMKLGTFTINLLPILNTLVTFIQQKVMMGVQPQDKNNPMSSMLYTMPLMMLFIFYKMPSGVTLYYLVSGALSLVQQYFILKGRSDDGKDSIKS